MCIFWLLMFLTLCPRMLLYLLKLLLLVHSPAFLTPGEQCGLHRSWQHSPALKCTAKGCKLWQPFHLHLQSVIVRYHHCFWHDQLKTTLCTTVYESNWSCQLPDLCCEVHSRRDIQLHMCIILQQSAIWHLSCFFFMNCVLYWHFSHWWFQRLKALCGWYS